MSTAPRSPNRLYALVWRWHFYAALYTIPFLIMLATTGLFMLWIAALQGRGDEHLTVARDGTPLAVSALIAGAEATVPGATATKYSAPLSPGHAATVVLGREGATTGVTLDPYSGVVLSSFPWQAGWYDLATEIHGTILIGNAGDWLIEAAASLGLLLTVTGFYLHLPRNGASLGRQLGVRSAARARSFWKSLHGALGLWVGLLPFGDPAVHPGRGELVAAPSGRHAASRPSHPSLS